MDTSTLLHSIMTLVTLITFVGIVVWAYSRKRKAAFDEAANAPFALPDDADGPDSHAGTRGGHSS
jgi:cytochrome c oxidase cbb3-type subunit IV